MAIYPNLCSSVSDTLFLITSSTVLTEITLHKINV